MIGERIRTLRTKKRMSQADLGSLIGIRPNTIAKWERGELTPRGTSIAKAAKALETTSAYILGETDDPSSRGYMLQTGREESVSEKRLIIRNHDMDINLPESPEGFEILRRVLDLISKKGAESEPEAVTE